MKAISTENLTKYYGKARGIIDVSLDVEEGAILGFIGPNGAGKSTTIRTLLGLISPTRGSAKVLGLDCRKDRKEILRYVGYISPDTAFYSGMRVSEIIELSARLRKKDCSAEAKRLADRLELDTKRKVGELSLGNKKKVGIVCAMQHEPRLYILDEPTGGLDPIMQQQFFELIKEKNAAGATVLLSSHILSEVSKYCTHAAVIREGRLLAAKRLNELFESEAKHIVLKGVKAFEPLEGMQTLKKNGNEVSFIYMGGAKGLIGTLSKLDFEDITITEPDLDEAFMHYYTNEDDGNDGILS
ncbi:MAG: ABC transporter ATP-binding protein [Clostridia bacterium]|nr:ABC transporter ATP-binding protein [Clostridia bacterium]